MKISKSTVSSSRILVKLLVCFVITNVVIGSSVTCQETKTVQKTTSYGLEIRNYKEIPEATEPCTPVECEWWRQLREAGNEAQRKGDDKSKKKYVLLFVEGLEKSYRVPLPDRPPQKLVSGPRPSLAKFWSAMENGTVEISVEIRRDASIGDVKVVKGLNKKLDQIPIHSARHSLFLPAVKDHVFVTDWHKIENTFFFAPGASRATKPY